jgi:hypothetical protein
MLSARLRRLLLMVAVLAIGGCAEHDSSDTVQAHDTEIAGADSVRLVDLNGAPVDIWSDGQDRIRVVVFTRSDCPISNRYAPDVRKLYDEFHPRGVDIYLIYVDPQETPETIRAHLHEFSYPCPALRDPDHTLVAFTQATVTPEAVVFAQDREIAYRGRISDLYAELGKARSAATKHDLRDAIAATLDGWPVAERVTKAIGCYIADLK